MNTWRNNLGSNSTFFLRGEKEEEATAAAAVERCFVYRTARDRHRERRKNIQIYVCELKSQFSNHKHGTFSFIYNFFGRDYCEKDEKHKRQKLALRRIKRHWGGKIIKDCALRNGERGRMSSFCYIFKGCRAL